MTETKNELLEVCKEWTLYFGKPGRLVGDEPTDEFKALYERMCDAIDAADPLFWSDEYPRRDQERVD